MDKRTTAKVIGVACTVVVVAFFVGAYFDMSYEFYKTMRWFLLVCFGTCAWISVRNKWLCGVFIFWALVYNPIGRPINPSRHLWELINVATIAWLGYWLATFVFSRKDEKAQADLERLQSEWMASNERQKNYFQKEQELRREELKRLSGLVDSYKHTIESKSEALRRSKEECEIAREELESEKARAKDYVRDLERIIGRLESEKTKTKDYVYDLERIIGRLESEKAKTKNYAQNLEGRVSALEAEVGVLKGDISTLDGDLSALKVVASKAWSDLKQWQEGGDSYDLGFMFEIYIAQQYEGLDWDVQLVGAQCGPYDLECTNMRTGDKKYIECKYWKKSKIVRREDVEGLINFVKRNRLPGRAAAIYSTTNVEGSFDGIEVHPNVSFATRKFVKGCNKRYYIPTDSVYRTLSLQSGEIEYFETTFEATLAGYSRGDGVGV